MIYCVLLMASIVLCACKSTLYNSYAKKNTPSINETFYFNAISYGVAILIALAGAIFSKETISLTTVLCALFYAMIVLSLQTVSITAMRVGAMSITAICVMYGMIIPSVAGPIFWREPIGVLQMPGIALMLVSLWFLKGETPAEKNKGEKKWMILALVAFFLSGMAGVMEKIHQSTGAKEERMSFVFVACLFMFAFSLFAKWIVPKPKEKVGRQRLPWLALPSGLVIGFYSMVNLTLSGKLNSIIYYPIANGGAMILTVLVSVIVFKERFDRRKVIGTIMGLIGILLLSLPI